MSVTEECKKVEERMKQIEGEFNKIRQQIAKAQQHQQGLSDEHKKLQGKLEAFKEMEKAEKPKKPRVVK